MINSINSGASMPPPPRTEQNLTSEQQSVISDTLSEFDVDNLSETDALSIVEAFSEAGIKPGIALEKAVSEAGFDARTIGELANISEEGSRPPPPPKQSSDEISSMVEYLAELLEEKLAASNSDSLSDEDKQSILAQVFEKFDIEESDSIINTTA
jgi:hypothetical protein